MDQAQRRDIDLTLDNRVDLVLDDENLADNPYVFSATDFVGNNWFKQNDKFVKLNLAEQDSIVFVSSPLTKLLQKDIVNVIVEFDYEVSNVSVNYPILSNFSLTCMGMTNYMLVENIITTQGHIEVDCSLFNFSSKVVNNAISEQGFKVGINFNGNKSNATIKLSNVNVKFKYQNRLALQEDSVINRIEPHIDFWREDDDLVLQIGGDATGKGIDHSGGGDVDTYTKSEIDAKLDLKVNTENGKGLSSNDYTLTEKTKLSGIENNANYYVHPSSHQTGMITESSALTNLETSENATQHEINLAIDNKINTGSGSVDWSDIENKPSDYPPSSHNHDDRYYTESEVDTALNSKQNTLISGTNIKTINNISLLGSGNISVGGGGGSSNLFDLNTTSQYGDNAIEEGVDRDGTGLGYGSDFLIYNSQAQKFYYDKNGSADYDTGNELATMNDLPTNSSIVDLIYPVGSIYMSVNSVNPSTLFGGTWEQIEDKFLLASGSSYSNGSTGGSADAVVVSHSHNPSTASEYFVTSESEGANNTRVAYSSSGNRYVDGMTSSSTPFHHRKSTETKGESGTGKNMPPYLVVNIWKRTA